MWQYNYNLAPYSSELYHYGVKGMKWGVRRYRNFDGSYTQAGLKRFDESLEKYEQADARYKDTKKVYKTAKKAGIDTVGMKTDIVNAKVERTQAKRKLNKDYKHLKQDKLGDQGKALYASGKTITSNNQITSVLSEVGSISMAAAAYNYRTGSLGDAKVTNFLAGVGMGAMTIAGIKGAVDYSQNRKLRAYYSHTSNY